MDQLDEHIQNYMVQGQLDCNWSIHVDGMQVAGGKRQLSLLSQGHSIVSLSDYVY